MRALALRGFAVLVFISACVSTRAVTIAEYLGGTGVNLGTDFIGQSFTVTSVGVFENIAFNFFALGFGGTIIPYASGPGYLFSEPWSGQGVLSTSPGFLGQTAAAGSYYTFSPTVTLLTGTKYYFYTSIIGLGQITTGGVYPGGEGYVRSPVAGSTFSGGVGSRNFRVTGDHVPDGGSTALMLGLPLAGLVLYRMRK